MVLGPSNQAYRLLRFCGWAALLVSFGLWAISTLSWPLARDQGILSWAGSVVLNGGVLYRDAWEEKGPLAVLPFTLAQRTFGHNMWGIRVFDLLVRLIDLIALAIVTLRFWDRKTAQYAVLLAALFSTWLSFAISSQPDEWCGCVVTIIVAVVSNTKRLVSSRVVAGCSLLLGVCVLQKPVYAIFVLLFAPFVDRNGRALLKTFATVAIGFSVPLIVTVAYFGLNHAIDSLVNVYLLSNLRANLKVEGSLTTQIRLFSYGWRAFLPLTVGVPFALFGAMSLLARNSRFAALYVIWASLHVAILMLQGKYFEYQWVPLIVPISLGAAISLRQLHDFRPVAATAVLTTFLLLFINDPVTSLSDWISYRTGRISRDDYDARFVYLNKNHFDPLTIRRLATYVHDRTSNNETVQVWGFDAGINYLADRRTPTRFGYTCPLQIGKNNPYQDAYRAEFLKVIRAHPPRYVLVPNNDAFGLMTVPSNQSFNEFHDFRDFVLTHYFAETTLANWTVYRSGS